MTVQLLERIRAEYLEMPGLRPTLAQVQRLCGVERTICQDLLNALVDTKFLCVSSRLESRWSLANSALVTV
jgi:hypothetical protein